jgi:hypothetical protein
MQRPWAALPPRTPPPEAEGATALIGAIGALGN